MQRVFSLGVLTVLMTMGASAPSFSQEDIGLPHHWQAATPQTAAKAVIPMVSVRPCTLLDTRRRAQGPALESDGMTLVNAHVRRCGIPYTAKAVSVRVTTFTPTGKGNLRFYRGDLGPPKPAAGILRFNKGRSVSGSFILPVPKDCNVAVLPFVADQGTVHVHLEVNGYSE